MKLSMKSTILIIDDDPAWLRLTSFNLYQKRIQCRDRTDNGFDGIEQLQQSQPDLIILDLTMPDLQGLEVHQHMLSNPKLAKTPILFATNDVSNFYKVDTQPILGKVFSKSGGLDTLVQTVSALLGE